MSPFTQYAEQLERHPMRLKDTPVPKNPPTPAAIERQNQVLRVLEIGPKLAREIGEAINLGYSPILKTLRQLEVQDLVYPNNKLFRKTTWHLKEKS